MKITHDFHIHTNLSLCAKPEADLNMYIHKAEENGLKKIAVTNHMWDHTVEGWHHSDPKKNEFYEVQTFEYLSSLKKEIDEADCPDLTVYFGCEAEYSFQAGRPAVTPQVAEQLDVLLVPNSHTHLTMPESYYEPHREHIVFMIDAFLQIVRSDVAKYITAIPHPFLAVGAPYDNRELLREMSDDDFKKCFSEAAQKGIALEINPNFIKNKPLNEVYEDPIFRMYQIGKDCGCCFTVGTDSHSEKGQDAFRDVYTLITLLDLKEKDFHPLTR